MAINVIHASRDLSPNHLKQLILTELKTPVIFKGFISTSWKEPLTWSPRVISKKLRDVCTRFKLCPKEGTMKHKELITTTDVVFETHCDYIDATFTEFGKWLEQEEEKKEEEEELQSKVQRLDSAALNDSKFSSFSRSIYWIYADYKYVNELCPNCPEIIESIDWSVFGFECRNGNQSTLWVGSEGACTPCHYDTYGCNLVAQLWGTKQWTLYAPTDSDKLYPTRIPYEESSVFSSVNIKSPQVDKFSNFSNATPYKVTLCPGDVLFVPYHWWHYVESLEPSVSVNTWLELPQDKEDKLKEAIVRILVSNFVTQENISSIVNPNETIFLLQDNLALFNTILSGDQSPVSITDFLNILASDEVLNIIKDKVKCTM